MCIEETERKEKKLNISDFRRRRRRRRLYSFRVCTFSYYPSISPEKCPKYLSFLRFSFFAFIIISARNSALFSRSLSRFSFPTTNSTILSIEFSFRQRKEPEKYVCVLHHVRNECISVTSGIRG